MGKERLAVTVERRHKLYLEERDVNASKVLRDALDERMYDEKPDEVKE